MEKMLDAGFWILVFKGNCPYFIQHQASSIQYPVSAHFDLNVRFQNFVIFGSGLSGLGYNNINTMTFKS